MLTAVYTVRYAFGFVLVLQSVLPWPVWYIHIRPNAPGLPHWHWVNCMLSQIARFMGPTWGPPGADKIQVGPMLAPWTLLSGVAMEPLLSRTSLFSIHDNDVIMGTIASKITSLTICLLNRLFRRRSKKTKVRVTGLCAGNSPGTGEFPTKRASNAENVSIWWRHDRIVLTLSTWMCMYVTPVLKRIYHHALCLCCPLLSTMLPG